jgi:hypothetical protein
MERIVIEDSNKKTIINIQNRTISGYSFYHDEKVKELTKDDLNIFKLFFLSNNNKRLPNEGKYTVILDNITGLKHYFLNGIEDYKLLFLNNGEDITLYKVENKLLKDNGYRKKEKLSMKERVFKIGHTLVRCTCYGLLYILIGIFSVNAVNVIHNPNSVYEIGPVPILSIVTGSKDLTVDDLVRKIKQSERLDTEDQVYLSNRDFLEDILVYANQYNYTKYEYNFKFHNIGVKTFKRKNGTRGFYLALGDPNSLYISDDSLTDDKYNDILSHEYVHLCQTGLRYNLLTESTAEILSNEYFEGTKMLSYPKEVYLVKKLMEIIGPEPIMHYIIGGNFTYIEEAVRPYVSNDEYYQFIQCLIRRSEGDLFYNEEREKEKRDTLDNLLTKIYERKFNRSIDDDPVMPLLSDPNLVRYYFNHRKVEKEGSYLKMPKIEDVDMTLEEAIKAGYVYMWQSMGGSVIKKISYEEYVNNTYDFDKELHFEVIKVLPVRFYVASDGKLHVYVRKTIDTEIKELPLLEERFNTQTK